MHEKRSNRSDSDQAQSIASPRAMCPVCWSTDICLLDRASNGLLFDYFICTACYQVWSLPKGEEGPVQHITDPKQPPRVLKRQIDY
jgi:hypothetical protein